MPRGRFCFHASSLASGALLGESVLEAGLDALLQEHHNIRTVLAIIFHFERVFVGVRAECVGVRAACARHGPHSIRRAMVAIY